MIVEGLQLFRLEIKMKLPAGVYAAAQQARSGCNPGADELSRARFFSRGRGLTFGHPLPPTPRFTTDALPRSGARRLHQRGLSLYGTVPTSSAEDCCFTAEPCLLWHEAVEKGDRPASGSVPRFRGMKGA